MTMKTAAELDHEELARLAVLHGLCEPEWVAVVHGDHGRRTQRIFNLASRVRDAEVRAGRPRGVRAPFVAHPFRVTGVAEDCMGLLVHRRAGDEGMTVRERLSRA